MLITWTQIFSLAPLSLTLYLVLYPHLPRNPYSPFKRFLHLEDLHEIKDSDECPLVKECKGLSMILQIVSGIFGLGSIATLGLTIYMRVKDGGLTPDDIWETIPSVSGLVISVRNLGH